MDASQLDRSTAAHLILSPTLEIVAVTDGYVRATGTERADLVGRHLLEVFPHLASGRTTPADPSHDDRAATAGRLAGAIAPELAEPLSVIETSCYMLRARTGESTELRRHVDRIGQQVQAAGRMLKTLVELTADHSTEPEPVRVGALARHLIDALPASSRRMVIDEIDALPPVLGQRLDLRHVVQCMLAAALDASAPAGTVVVGGHTEGGWIELVIGGSGGNGSGGSRKATPEVVDQIVRRHGGTLDAYWSSSEVRSVLRLPVHAR